MTRPLVVLGATGSIGMQTLEVAEHLGAEVVAVASRSPSEALIEIGRRFPEAEVVAAGGSGEEREAMHRALGSRASFGSDALLELAGRSGSTVVNGIVGAAGLRASAKALRAGNRLALANKETLVVGGRVITDLLAAHGGEIIPVDSEHSALFQLRSDGQAVTRLVLTASGGPFRGRSLEDLAEVTPAEALAHPTWNMGARITVDSATLANKGLEVIEAHVLFGVAYDAIDVVVHPQSAVHSLVELADGSLIGHIGATDMRIPIQYALTYPQRAPTPVEPFSLAGITLTFEPADLETFPALGLAYQAGRAGGSAPAAFNAADEIAVEAFLTGRLGFLGIPEIIERTLELLDWTAPSSIDEVLEADSAARSLAASLVAGVC